MSALDDLRRAKVALEDGWYEHPIGPAPVVLYWWEVERLGGRDAVARLYPRFVVIDPNGRAS